MADKKKYLVDTSVIIALFRGNQDAKALLNSLSAINCYLCDITILELLAGCDTVEKRDNTLKAISGFNRLYLSQKVSEKAMQLMQRYSVKKRGVPQMFIPDCLIAAHALSNKMQIVTFNKKDFEYIQNINIHSSSK